ncbi:vesicle transport protein USE1 [Nephila pilipes]|uniref:Vesicle transport protein USE1 n=1 Tax=Nephila pilipes TaxID=299642 RepID=A0A8X6TPM5_NEPPI|nr:vesicle transport protein USE1 [Nephila pilipes]
MITPMSREEINFTRLLTRCENFVPKRDPNEWRLEQYVKNLEERLAELKKMNTCQPSQDTLTEYTRRVEFLRGVLEAEKLPTVIEKAMANQLLAPGTFTSPSNKIHQQTKAQYLREMRDELFRKSDDSNFGSDGVRLRNTSSNVPQEDFDAVMQYHNSMQEKVAEEMMSIVQNLKQNSLLAGHIIKKDTEAIQKSTVLADDRHAQLKVESEKLETFVKKACNWGVWIMIAIVCVTFMWMIVFIRLFPKR